MHHDNGIWVSTEDLMRDESFVQSSEREFSVDNLDEHGGQWTTGRRDFLKLLGFGLGAATIAASCEIPVKKAIPYVTKPDSIVPGVANYFASSFVNGGDYCSILVKTREGRPIKIEGNTLSSVTKGGTSARAQALVLSLYDTRRIQSAGTVADGNVTKKEWAELDREVKSKLASGNIRIISNTNTSPTAQKALAEFKAKYPTATVTTYDPVSSAALLAANEMSFGVRAFPTYQFDQAEVIVSFGADFLGTWGSPLEQARSYVKGRKVVGAKGAKMSRHYQVESNMSLTGSNAIVCTSIGFKDVDAVVEFVIRVDSHGGECTCFGFTLSSPPSDPSYSSSNNMFVRAYNGQLYAPATHRVAGAVAPAYHQGDRIAFYINGAAGVVSMSINDESVGVVFRNLGAQTLYPAIATYSNNRTASMVRAERVESLAELTGHSCLTPVAEVARKARVGRLILSHIGVFDLDAAIAELKQTYTGPLTVGEDLQCTQVQ